MFDDDQDLSTMTITVCGLHLFLCKMGVRPIHSITKKDEKVLTQDVKSVDNK